jgi:D-alanine-D-alanine ligase
MEFVKNKPLDINKEREILWDFHAKSKGKKVGLIYGPKSREDKFYINNSPKKQLSFTALMDALQGLDFNVSHIDPTQPNFIQFIQDSDLCFLNMHGEYGEDGRLQGLLDFLGKSYIGSGVLANAIGLNKVLFKRVMTATKINTPPFVEFSKMLDPFSLAFPLIAKPITGGSSIGTHLIHDVAEFKNYVENYDNLNVGDVFLENFIKGKSLTVGVLELEYSLITTPVIEVCFDSEFYDEAIKINSKGENLSEYVIPAQIEKSINERINEIALSIYNLLGCRGFYRVDFMLEDFTNNLYVLEINTIPGMSCDGNFTIGIKALGFNYDEMVLAVLRSCLWKK